MLHALQQPLSSAPPTPLRPTHPRHADRLATSFGTPGKTSGAVSVNATGSSVKTSEGNVKASESRTKVFEGRVKTSGVGTKTLEGHVKTSERGVKTSGGFTLIEMLVAISVLSLMLLLASRIFFDAQEGVKRGLQTSQIIAQARAISQPLMGDLRQMNVFESKYGSNAPGFLVIAQQSFPGVKFPPAGETTSGTDGWIADLDGDGVAETFPNLDDFMRSDQIAFFRDANKLESLTPGGDDRYDSQAKARHARIWYGHVWPVDADINGAPALNDWPGQAGYDLMTQMTLGRQALLLIERNPATTYPNGVAGDVGAGEGPNNRIAIGGSARDETWEAQHDVFDLRGLGGRSGWVYDDLGIDPAGGPRGLFRTPTYDVTPPVAQQSAFGTQVSPATGLPTPGYKDFALHWLYLAPGRRLRARTSLDNDFGSGIFTADDIAELHTAFAPHVADFAIEFAADWVDDLDLNDFDGDGNLFEPDGMPDNEPDRDGAGNIVWYTAINQNPDGNGGSGETRGDGAYDGIGFNPTAPVTYRYPAQIPRFDGTTGSINAQDTVVFQHNTGSGDFDVFVWSHTGDNLATDELTNPPSGLIEGGGKYWPYLIRFRYRLVDGGGDFRSVDIHPTTGQDVPIVGRWFEQIVPVPRPQGLY